MSDIDINRIQQNIEQLQDQNAIDFQQWKRLGQEIKKLEGKIKTSDCNLNLVIKKIKADYESLRRIIIDENVQLQLNSKIEQNKNEINKKVNNETFQNKVDEINSQLDNIVQYVDTKGDGVNDDTSVLQNIINNANENTTIILEKDKKYVIKKPLIINKKININGNGATILWNGNESLGSGNSIDYGVITYNGKLSTTSTDIISMSSNDIITDLNTTFRETTIKLNSISNFNINDYVFIEVNENDIWSTDYSDYKPRIKWLCKISDIDEENNTIMINYSHNFNFKEYSGTITKVSPLSNFYIKNLNFIDLMPPINYSSVENSDRKTWVDMIKLTYCDTVDISNITTLKHKQRGISLNRCSNIKINNCNFDNPSYIGSGGGYGIQFANTIKSSAEGVKGSKVRHLIDMSLSSTINITNCYSETENAYDCHGISEYLISITNSVGGLVLGNGINNFPIVIEDIKVSNSVLTNLGIEFCNNIDFISTKIMKFLKRGDVKVNHITFTSCEIYGKADIITIRPNNRDYYDNDTLFKICNSLYEIKNITNHNPAPHLYYFDSIDITNNKISGYKISNTGPTTFRFEDCGEIKFNNNNTYNFCIAINKGDTFSMNNLEINSNRFYCDSLITSEASSLINFNTNFINDNLKITINDNIFSSVLLKNWLRIQNNLSGENSVIYITNNYFTGLLKENISGGLVKVSMNKIISGNSYTENLTSSLIKNTNIFYATTLPTTGKYVKGDIIYNLNPSSGGFIGWVCIASGDFSTTSPEFKTFGVIS